MRPLAETLLEGATERFLEGVGDEPLRHSMRTMMRASDCPCLRLYHLATWAVRGYMSAPHPSKAQATEAARMALGLDAAGAVLRTVPDPYVMLETVGPVATAAYAHRHLPALPIRAHVAWVTAVFAACEHPDNPRLADAVRSLALRRGPEAIDYLLRGEKERRPYFELLAFGGALGAADVDYALLTCGYYLAVLLRVCRLAGRYDALAAVLREARKRAAKRALWQGPCDARFGRALQQLAHTEWAARRVQRRWRRHRERRARAAVVRVCWRLGLPPDVVWAHGRHAWGPGFGPAHLGGAVPVP